MDSTLERFRETLNLSGVLDKLRQAWSKDTSATPDEWTRARASSGQCAVTALIVQDLFGGRLLRCVVDGHLSHYFNEIPFAGVTTRLDLTRDQFLPSCHMTEPEERTREYVLSYPATARRYELLKERLS